MSNSVSVYDVDQFNIAERLAFLTSELDDSKHALLPEVRIEAMKCIQLMWKTVELLASDRIGEIYDLME